MKNGYRESLFETSDGVDYLTGIVCATARHELFSGAYRKLAKHDGLWIAVSPESHELLHRSKAEGSAWRELMKKGQLLWLLEDYDRSVNDWIRRYGKNYL